MTLDTQGHLVEFEAVPPQIDTSTEKASAPRWDGLFTAAGLDPNQFENHGATMEAARYKRHPGSVGRHMARAPGIAFTCGSGGVSRGNPVYFAKLVFLLDQSGSHAGRTKKRCGIDWHRDLIYDISLHHRAGNSDGPGQRALWQRRPTWRGTIGSAGLPFDMGRGLAVCAPCPTQSEFGIFWIATGWGLIYGALVWLLYVALEPHVRRRWPSSLISWSRLLTGQLRDPVVGRDLLVGILAGVFLAVARSTVIIVPGWMGKVPAPPDSGVAVVNFSGLHIMIGGILLNIVIAAFLALACFFIFFLIRLVLRKEWLAVLVTALLPSLSLAFGDHPVLYTAFELLLCTILLVVLIRFGLLALAVTLCVGYILSKRFPSPHIFRPGTRGRHSSCSYLCVATAIFGFYTSTLGKAMFGELSLDG